MTVEQQCCFKNCSTNLAFLDINIIWCLTHFSEAVPEKFYDLIFKAPFLFHRHVRGNTGLITPGQIFAGRSLQSTQAGSVDTCSR